MTNPHDPTCKACEHACLHRRGVGAALCMICEDHYDNRDEENA